MGKIKYLAIRLSIMFGSSQSRVHMFTRYEIAIHFVRSRSTLYAYNPNTG